MARKGAGRAPIFSALENDFIDQLQSIAIADCNNYVFENIGQFCEHMNYLAQNTAPSLPPFQQLQADINNG